MKGLGFSALRFDFKKKTEHLGIRNKENHGCAQAAKTKKKEVG